MQRLNETRQKFIRLKTSLLNKIHALSALGRAPCKERISRARARGLERAPPLAQEWTASERLELEIIIEQIGSLKQSIGRRDCGT